jgi:hypothetical protein
MSSFPVRRKADRPPPPFDIAKAIRILEPNFLRSSTQGTLPSDRRFLAEDATWRENPG